jgi:hypothetical protein
MWKFRAMTQQEVFSGAGLIQPSHRKMRLRYFPCEWNYGKQGL